MAELRCDLAYARKVMENYDRCETDEFHVSLNV